jgi:asparagine synthase (glutamine-hydrolysing)
MCAICGKVTRGVPPDEGVIETMAEVMRHRGPDGRGFYRYPQAGGVAPTQVRFAHNRLAIIDVEGGAQPLANEDETVWTMLNGEIYNFVELREELRSRGHRFRTGCDTEVIVHAWEEWGEGMMSRLNGMFAFALFDERSQTLLLARDRLGVKPLVYALVPDGLVFASEMKALLADPDVPDDLDYEALVEYLTFNYTLGARTLLKAIRRLPAAHLLTWRNGVVEVREYWDVQVGATVPVSEATAAAMVRDALAGATRRRLRSDVPLGALLSGGIDSSVVVSLMAGELGRSLKAFSADFTDAAYSELPYARMVAQRYEIDHRTVTIEPDVERLVERLVWTNDEPLGDSSTVPTYLLSEFVRGHVTVALSGDGGDETFFGYETYQADQLFQVYRRLPAAVRRAVIPGLVDRLPVSFAKVSLDFKLRQFVAAGLADPFEAHCSWRRMCSESERAALLDPDVTAATGHFSPFETPRRYFDRHPDADFLTRCLYVDLRTWLTDDVLVKVDRASMAHALEVRSPFLDREVVETAFSLPRRLKLKGATKKYIVRRAFADRVPPAIFDRPKAGFNAPVASWLRGPLSTLVDDTLLARSGSSLDVLRRPAIARLVDELRSGVRDHSHKIWGLLNLELWHASVVRGRRTPATARSAGGFAG